MKLFVNLPRSEEHPDGKDDCGFFFDFSICDADLPQPPGRLFPCGAQVIWEPCTVAGGKYYCVTRRKGYQYWCLSI
jgi:hypothetical protein